MKILFMGWRSAGRKDLEEAFVAEGHSYIYPPFSIEEKTYSDLPELEQTMLSLLREETPDIVFSVNYYPAISILCNKCKIRYISWIYDSPYVMLYSYTALNPCNVIYVFDRELYLEFHRAGIHTVHYMPMAANVERLDRLSGQKVPLYDISFIGSLYTEQHNFYDRMTGLSEYAKGYLEALMAAQRKIQGYNFIQESLSPILDDLYQALPMDPNPDGVESREYLYAQYVINRKITGLERTDLISAITKRHTLDLFTHDAAFHMPNLRNHGTVSYYEQMPLVFRHSRINLNISLRSIKSGIPLRAFDIMGSGGFLLSNFQADFLDAFTPGEDFVYYESEEDLLQKIDYYLDHEDERAAIAKNGHDKVAAAHTFRHRVREMLNA